MTVALGQFLNSYIFIVKEKKNNGRHANREINIDDRFYEH